MKKQTITERFATSLRKMRTERGVSQRQTAREFGVDIHQYFLWERGGNVTLKTLQRVAEFYGVSAADLL